MLLPPDYIIISSWCLWMLAYDCFSSFSSRVAYFNTFGISEKLCWLNPYMACFVFLRIAQPWWMHCQQGGEICTNHTLGEMHHSRGSFACIAFEKGSFAKGEFELLNFVFDLCLIDSILSHDWYWALFAFFLGIMWFLSQSRWAVALVLGDWDFASSWSFLPFHLASGSFGRSSVHFLF